MATRHGENKYFIHKAKGGLNKCRGGGLYLEGNKIFTAYPKAKVKK